MEDLLMQVTGGDSYVYFDPKLEDKTELSVVLRHHGKYPISPLLIEVLETGRNDGLGGHAKAHFPPSRVIEFPIYGPGTSKSFYWTLEPSGDLAVYGFFIEARNGTKVQELQVRKTDEGWATASRIQTFPDRDKTVFERVDENYPRSERGEVEWENPPF